MDRARTRLYDHRPVKIDVSEVRRIANLASLEFEEAEMPRLAEQLSSILTYMESLRRLIRCGVQKVCLKKRRARATRALQRLPKVDDVISSSKTSYHPS